MSEQPENVILHSEIFSIRNKRCVVNLYEDKLIWNNGSFLTLKIQKVLPLKNIISVTFNDKSASSSISLTSKSFNSVCSFTIHYAKKKSKNIWRYRKIIFKNRNPAIVETWINLLKNELKNFKQRPKKLLVFVNPNGGKKKALEIYNRLTRHLFEIAEVEINLIITQRANQIQDMILDFDLRIYDGIVCIGGDGTFSEVFNGLVLRTCRDKNIDHNDIQSEFPTPEIPVGVIPAGSTDTIAICLHGTTDKETAALQIIFGDYAGLDLVSVHNENKLLRMYASILSYGYLGEVAGESDKYRWMGTKRYDFIGLKNFLCNKGFQGEIALCLENDEIDENEMNCKCNATSNCMVCQRKGELKTAASGSSNNSESVWKTVKGNFFSVNAPNISCMCARCPAGISPYSHIGDGCVNLVLVQHTSFFSNLRLLFTLTNKKKSLLDLPFVESYRAKEFCFRASSKMAIANSRAKLPKISKWNCDGEIIPETDVMGKVRCQLLKVYTRGIQNTKKK